MMDRLNVLVSSDILIYAEKRWHNENLLLQQ
jgi:hypothetical protein